MLTLLILSAIVCIIIIANANPEPYKPVYIDRCPEQLCNEFYDFQDHYKENFKDMSHLSPSEAQKELNQRRVSGEFIPTDEYIGYMQVIATDSNRLYQDLIQKLSSEETQEWFYKSSVMGYTLNAETLSLIGMKLKPLHQPKLLKLLRSVEPEHVPNWIALHKKRGFFFSQGVYDAAFEKYNKQKLKQKHEHRQLAY